MDVIEKAFEETPSYEKKLQEAREKHLGTFVDFNTLEVIYEEDFIDEKALSTVWVDKSPDGNEAKSCLCVRGVQQRLQKTLASSARHRAACRYVWSRRWRTSGATTSALAKSARLSCTRRFTRE